MARPLFMRVTRRRCALSLAALCPTLLFAILLVTVGPFGPTPAEGFPYPHSSGVTELTPATLASFLNTHKPAVVLFYAPWCGHCKHFHPEYARLAESAKGAIRVGAINADEYSDVARQYGIRGFPTIKYWRMGAKSVSSPEEYQGPRSASSIQAVLMSSVKADRVRTNVDTADALRQVVAASPKATAAVLFSSKPKVPPMFAILASSPKLQELPFVFIQERESGGIAAGLGVSGVPAIAIVRIRDGESGVMEAVPYTDKAGISYEPLATFFLTAVDGQTQRGAGAEPLAAGNGEARDGKIEVRDAQKAIPVAPVTFHKDETLGTFCAAPNGVRRMAGSAIWCVLVRSGNVDIAKVHASFRNEPFVFVDASRTDVRELQGSLQEYVNGLTLAGFGLEETSDATSAVLLIRKTKPDLVRIAAFTGIDSTAALQEIMERVVSGQADLRRWSV